MQRAQFEPAGPLVGGDVDGIAQCGPGGVRLAAAVGQFAVDSPQLGFQVALVVLARPRECILDGGSPLMELAGRCAGPRKQ